jgi:hypothetical protein
MRNFKIICIALCLNIGLVTSCADYLDIVPDSLTTVDDAFSSRTNAEKFWATCFGYMPSVVRPFHDPGWIASRGDEFWYYPNQKEYPSLGLGDTPHGLAIMQGGQNTDQPYLNYWDGDRAGIPLFQAIRECNIFLENVEEKNIVPDVSYFERTWWIGEVKFLKAYYHFYLMHLYGPIPIIRRNPDMNASPEEVRVYREPIDDVVNYIVELLDEALVYLDDAEVQTDLNVAGNSWYYGGRITSSIARAVKAKVLVWAASPLFNGNNFYTDFKDSRGKQLIPAGNPDLGKWAKAAQACLEAIRAAETTGYHTLNTRYDSRNHGEVSDDTELKYVLRYAVTEPFNREIVWPSTHPTDGFGGWGTGIQNLWQMHLERESMPPFQPWASNSHNGSMGTTLKMAEQFYTNNGLPIEDDEEWQRRIGGLEARYDKRQAEGDAYHQYYIKQGITTAQLNFYREPRFYAYVGFDGGIWEGVGKSEADSYVVNKNASTMTNNVVTGYYMKKVVHPQSTFNQSGSTYSYNSVPYTFPLIRLSDLYLLYAEALNESVEGDGATPPTDVYTYVNKVRERAGLLSVQETWDRDICKRRDLYKTKSGMREIIRRERSVELCFEGKRGEDMRRWRIAHEQFNDPVRGWNGLSPNSTATSPAQLTNDSYYLVTDHYVRTTGYSRRDYLWPIKSDNININNNLVQNPDW